MEIPSALASHNISHQYISATFASFQFKCSNIGQNPGGSITSSVAYIGRSISQRERGSMLDTKLAMDIRRF